ncbi:MAG: molybdenum cofactor guanylyltransferase [Clostridiales bacterium]|nr:molybdenum cofactor guanylyltransferase [Clostridiales bacterium]
MAMKEKYGCVLLAGGSGRRIGGRNKAELEYENQTFAERITQELSTLGLQCYLSSAVYEQKLPEGWKLVRDRVTGEDGSYIGPIGGICSCLIQAAEDGLEGLFFTPCDAPLFRNKLIKELKKILDAETCGSVKPDALVWRTADGKVQTTYGWYSVRCLPFLKEEIRNGRYKLIDVLNKLNCRMIDTKDPDIRDEWFVNINTEEEFRRLAWKGSYAD